MEIAGSELDSRVARNIFGYVVIIDTQLNESYIMGLDRKPLPVPQYSTDTETAQLIVEMLKKHGFSLAARNKQVNGEYQWVASFSRDDGRSYLASYGNTLPAAICAAGLSAVQGTNSNQKLK
jgi:hypothetical protein